MKRYFKTGYLFFLLVACQNNSSMEETGSGNGSAVKVDEIEWIAGKSADSFFISLENKTAVVLNYMLTTKCYHEGKGYFHLSDISDTLSYKKQVAVRINKLLPGEKVEIRVPDENLYTKKSDSAFIYCRYWKITEGMENQKTMRLIPIDIK